MMHKLLYQLFFITLTIQNIITINGHVLPESHINMTQSEFDSLIKLTFGSLNNESDVNKNEKSDNTGSEYIKPDDQTRTSESNTLQSIETPSIVSINNAHTAEKREIDTKTSSSTESILSEDYDKEGCICVPYDECDPSNRTISTDLEGLIDERSRTCDSPLEVLCGCNSPKYDQQEDQIKINKNKESSTQKDDNDNGSPQNFNCVCQKENKINSDQTHQVTTGPYGHPHENNGNSGTTKPSDELHCVCQRRQIHEPSEKTSYGHHHIYKPVNKGDSENDQQAEELHCVCQHGLSQTTNKWSYGQTHHKDENSGSASGSTYYNQQGNTYINTGSSYQTTDSTIYGKHDNTDSSGSTHNSNSHSSAESHNGGGYTHSINENSNDLHQTTVKIDHDNKYNSGTSGSTGTSNSYSHSQSGSHTHGETNYSQNNDDKTSTSHHTANQDNHNNQGYTTGTFSNSDTSHSNSHSTDYLSHQQNNNNNQESGNTGIHKTHDDKHHISGAEGSTGATHSYSYSHAEAEAHSTSTSSHNQDGYSHSGTTSSFNQHSTEKTNGYTFTTESTINTDSIYSQSHSQSESHSESSGGTSYNNQDKHLDGHKSDTTSSHHDSNLSNHDKHAQNSGSHIHSSTGTDTHTTQSHSQSEAHSESSGGTSYNNQDEHLDGHKSDTTSSHHDSNLSNHDKHAENSGSYTHSSTGTDTYTLSTTDKIDYNKQTSGTYGGTGTTNSYSYSHAEAEAHSSTGTSYNQGEHTQDHKGTSNSTHHEHTSGIDETSGVTHSIGGTYSSQGNQQHGQDITSQQHTHEQNHNNYGTDSSNSGNSNSYSHTQSQSSSGTNYGQDSYSHGQDSTSISHEHTDDKNHGYSTGTGGSTGSSSSNSHIQSNSGEINNGKGDHFHNEEGSIDSSHSDDKKHGEHDSSKGTSGTSSTSSGSYSHSSSNSHSSGGTSHTTDEHSHKQEGSSSHYNTNEQSHSTDGYTSQTGNSGDNHSHSSTGTDYGHTQSNEGSNSDSFSHSQSNSQSSSGSYGTSHGSTDQNNYGHHNYEYNSTSNHLPTEEPYDFEGCGYSKDSVIAQRIKNDGPDSESLFGQYPWMVAILLKTKDTNDQHKDKVTFVCGGSLIHPQVVMTATHCIIKKDDKTLAVRAGEWNAQADDEILSYQQEDIERIIRHPDYYSGALYNDISLIITKKPFRLADNVNIVCLPPPNLSIDYTEKCLVSGWGKESLEKTSKYQSILRQVDIPLVPHQQCQDKLRKTRLGDKFKLHNSFICAGGELNKDTCLGDGGGPLVCPVKGSIERYYQVGIVSWGIGCGTETPAVYANVKSFVKWIDEQMHKYNLKPQYNY